MPIADTVCKSMSYETPLGESLAMRDLHQFASILREMEDVCKSVFAEHELSSIGNLTSSHRRYLTIIQSMTTQERASPQLLLLECSRMTRIANGAGVDANSIGQMLKEFERLSRASSFTKPVIPVALRTAPEVCQRYHANLLAGTCPWCGKHLS